MNKTVASVIDDINEWENPRGGSVFYVTAFFTDETVLSVGRKDHDAALEVQGLLREAIGTEQDFTLEPAGQTKSGKDKFKLLGFGTPGGAATYTAPGVQGGPAAVAPAQGRPGRSPEPSSEQASIRAAVAVKAAVELGGDINTVLENADVINAWMLEKTSEPALSEYRETSAEGQGFSPSVTPQAGAGSEDLPQENRPLPADSASSQGSPEGEAGDPVSHIHDYQPAQGVRGFLVCACGKTRKKETVQ